MLAGTLSVILEGGGEGGGGAQQASVPLAAGRPQPARTGEPVRFIKGDYAGQRGTVVSELEDGDLGEGRGRGCVCVRATLTCTHLRCAVVKVGEGADSDQGRPDIVTADAVVRMAR